MAQTNTKQESRLGEVVSGRPKNEVDAITAALFDVTMCPDRDMDAELSRRGLELSEEEVHILNMEVIRIRMESGLM